LKNAPPKSEKYSMTNQRHGGLSELSRSAPEQAICANMVKMHFLDEKSCLVRVCTAVITCLLVCPSLLSRVLVNHGCVCFSICV
jgi:hypothetical protein